MFTSRYYIGYEFKLMFALANGPAISHTHTLFQARKHLHNNTKPKIFESREIDKRKPQKLESTTQTHTHYLFLSYVRPKDESLEYTRCCPLALLYMLNATCVGLYGLLLLSLFPSRHLSSYVSEKIKSLSLLVLNSHIHIYMK